MTCQLCNKDLPFWEVHRIPIYKLDKNDKQIKLVRYCCEKCLGWK